MISGKYILVGAACVLAALGSVSAEAQETTTYDYDALGRLARTGTAGGPNSGTSTGTCFDKAGNRVQYVVSASGLPTCATQTSSLAAPRTQAIKVSQAKGK